MAYATVLKAHMSALKKREKKDKKEKKPATVVQPQPSWRGFLFAVGEWQILLYLEFLQELMKDVDR